MKQPSRCVKKALAVASGLALICPALASTTITTFDNFTSDALYAGWASATIVSGPTAYSITAEGYGANYKYIGFPPIDGTGNTHLELTLTLSGPPAASGQLGPIIELIDGDGTDYNFAWYGQTLGSHVLTMPLNAPTWVSSAGATPGLDLTTLTHMHMQLDPGSFGTSDFYTVSFENLALVTVPEPSTLALAGLGAVGLLIRRRRH